MNETIEWTGAIADTRTAINASGGIEGGGRVTFDVPDQETAALAALLAVRGCVLRITVEVVG